MKKYFLVFILLSSSISLLPSQETYKVIDRFKEHSLCQAAINKEYRKLSKENRKYVYFTCKKNRTIGSYELLIIAKTKSYEVIPSPLNKEKKDSLKKNYTNNLSIENQKKEKPVLEINYKTDLIFEDFRNSKLKITKVTSKEVDEIFSQLVRSVRYKLLNETEEKNIFSFKLLDKYKEDIGVTKKRKYFNQHKSYMKSLEKSLSLLESGESRKKSRIDSILKRITKHVNSYGGEFLRKAEFEEKKLIHAIYKDKKEEKYNDALILFEVDSDVEGLNIFVDNKRQGKTPNSIYLEPRKYSFVLQNKAFKIEKIANPREEKFLYAKLSDSSWTDERIQSIKLNLSSSSLSNQTKTTEDSFFKSIESLKAAQEFISSYNQIKKSDPELDKEVSQLVASSETKLAELKDKVNKDVLNVSSLDDLKQKIILTKKLNKSLSKGGLDTLDNLEEESLIAYLDTQDPAFEVNNDTNFNSINKNSLKDLDKERFLLYSKVLSSDIDQKILSQKNVEGSFHADTRQKLNPDYDRAVQKRDKAYRDYMEAKYEWERNKETCARQSSSSRAFWCAVLLAPKSGNYEAAQAELERTPRIINEKIYQGYYFKETKIQGTKSITYEVGIIDLKNKKIHRKEFNDKSDKNFKIYSGLRDDERNSYRYKGDSQRDLERFFDRPHVMRVSNISKNIKDYKFTTRSANLTTSLDNFVSSLNKTSKSNRSSNKFNNNNGSELLEADDRFHSVVKVLDNIDGSFGTGFYISKNEIITNAHVVGNKKIINIENFDGEEFTGRVIKKEREVDLALIKVNKNGKAIQFWDSNSRIKAGSSVEAIGHPNGLFFSITRGIVSALRQDSLIDFGKKVKQIQTDVPINFGNSGGPLFIGDKVIGVNTKGYDKSVYEGLNFAIYYQEVIDFAN